MLDANGQPISVLFTETAPIAATAPCLSQTGGKYTAADCFTLTADQFKKFGFFRTVRQHYDRRLGTTEAQRQYLANRWNIWDKTIVRDGAGSAGARRRRQGAADPGRPARHPARSPTT